MKLILFDVDGTLIRGGGAGRRSLGLAFREVFGLDDVDEVMRHVAFNGRTDPVIIRDVAAAGGIPAASLDDQFEAFFESYLRHLRQLTTQPPAASLCPGFPDLLDRLEARHGVTLGLLTGNIEAGARIKLQPFELNRYFPAGGFGSDSEDRGVIARVARQKFEVLIGHPIDARDVLVIGDTRHDVACGRQNAFRTLAVATGGVPIEELRQADPDLLFEDLGDVAAVLIAVEQEMGLAPG